MRFPLYFFALCGAMQASAQTVEFSIEQTSQCVSLQPAPDCVGLATKHCIEQTDYGDANIIMSACVGEELKYWELFLGLINTNLSLDGEGLDEHMPWIDSQRHDEALDDVNEAWKSYRDKFCTFESLSSPEGAARNFSFMNCVMHETAKFTLSLGKILDQR